MKKTLIIVAMFIGVLLCAVGYADSQYRTSIGKQAPALRLPAQDNRAPETSLADQAGKYVMLNFGNRPMQPLARLPMNIQPGSEPTPARV